MDEIEKIQEAMEKKRKEAIEIAFEVPDDSSNKLKPELTASDSISELHHPFILEQSTTRMKFDPVYFQQLREEIAELKEIPALVKELSLEIDDLNERIEKLEGSILIKEEVIQKFLNELSSELKMKTEIKHVQYSIINEVIEIAIFYKPITKSPRLERREIISSFNKILLAYPSIMTELTILTEKYIPSKNENYYQNILFTRE